MQIILADKSAPDRIRSAAQCCIEAAARSKRPPTPRAPEHEETQRAVQRKTNCLRLSAATKQICRDDEELVHGGVFSREAWPPTAMRAPTNRQQPFDRTNRAFRRPKRLTITVPFSTYQRLVVRSDHEGRSLSNLAAFLLEIAISRADYSDQQ
ncbi:MAG: hypothetical protein VKK98_07190 [Cyanobacteriota bacterium]|nr:hypothetical protein [Cyanobacteriota bacterium]